MAQTKENANTNIVSDEQRSLLASILKEDVWRTSDKLVQDAIMKWVKDAKVAGKSKDAFEIAGWISLGSKIARGMTSGHYGAKKGPRKEEKK